jgi:hypothetical protein
MTRDEKPLCALDLQFGNILVLEMQFATNPGIHSDASSPSLSISWSLAMLFWAYCQDDATHF